MSRILFITEIHKTMLLSGGFLSFAPLWLSAMLKKEGHKCDISNVDYKEAVGVIESFKPDIVAFSAHTGFHVAMVELNRKLKERYHFYTIFGGPHATYSPEIIEEDGIDALCRGEGFEALPEFINKLEKGEDVTNVLNFWVKSDGKIHKNPHRHLVKNLDDLPFLDRTLYEKYREYRWTKTASIMTSIGCPYKCTYCFNHLNHKMRLKGDKVVRQRSVDNVIKEIKEVRKRYPHIEYITFRDDMLIHSTEWAKEFAEKYPREVGLPFHALMRPERITEEIGDYLKKAGVHYVGTAVESGNDFLRNKVLNRPMTKEQILNGLKILHDRNIKYTIYNIIGVPGETLDTAMETWEINAKYRPTLADSFLLTPYPKTEIYEYSIAHGYLDPIKEYPLTYHADLLLKMDDKRRIENFHQLFGIAVQYPFLMPAVKVLIRLPLRPIYNIIRKSWKYYVFRYKFYPYRVPVLQNLRIMFDAMFIAKA